MTPDQLLDGKIKMWETTLKNPRSTEGQKNYALYNLHKFGVIDCDSDNCGRCGFHSSEEIAAERKIANE